MGSILFATVIYIHRLYKKYLTSPSRTGIKGPSVGINLEPLLEIPDIGSAWGDAHTPLAIGWCSKVEGLRHANTEMRGGEFMYE